MKDRNGNIINIGDKCFIFDKYFGVVMNVLDENNKDKDSEAEVLALETSGDKCEEYTVTSKDIIIRS